MRSGCLALGGERPDLDIPQESGLDIDIECRLLEDRDEVVYEFSASDLGKERVATVLDADIDKLVVADERGACEMTNKNAQ
jgi:hypothetical protein